MWFTRLLLGCDAAGGRILSVLARKTYAIAHGETASEERGRVSGFLTADRLYGEAHPGCDAVCEESDLVAFKPQADVTVIGAACPPRGTRARSLEVALEIGNHVHAVQVFGDRTVRRRIWGSRFSDPEPFTSMPLHYGNAYGGRDACSFPGREIVCPLNPVGKGCAVTRGALEGLNLPNLEDPQDLLTPDTICVGRDLRWEEMPVPRALGPLGRNCRHRFSQLASGDARFFNHAPPGQRFDVLNGDEPVRLRHLDAGFPVFEFRLPGDSPVLWIEKDDEPEEELEAVLQTVVIRKEENLLTMVWRGSIPCEGPEAMAAWSSLRFGVDE